MKMHILCLWGEVFDELTFFELHSPSIVKADCIAKEIILSTWSIFWKRIFKQFSIKH